MAVRSTAANAMRAFTSPVRNAGITTKIVALVLLTCSVFGAACALSLVGISDLTSRNEALAKNDVATLAAASKLRGAVAASNEGLLYYVLAQSQVMSDDVTKRDAEVAVALKELRDLATTESRREQVAAFTLHRDELLKSGDEVRAKVKAGDVALAAYLIQAKTQYLSDIVLSDVEDFVSSVIADVQRETDTARKLGEQTRKRVIALLIFGTAFALLGGWLAARAIAKPLRNAVRVLTAVADGDFTRRLHSDSKDEVGRMATALNATLDLLRNTFSTIGDTVTALATASDELSSVSRTMSTAAMQTATDADAVATAAGQVSASVESVAAAAEELSMSIREVAGQAANAASVAEAGAARAMTASGTVSELGAASAKIEDVTGLITSIAEQTHLLALNATIEAAHAGAVGKGFGVVAQEVKELARQTTDASDDVRKVVVDIQEGSRNAVDAMADVASVIQEVNENQATIAAAVEEQNATTRMIGSSAAMAATGSGEIARNIIGVAAAARDATAGAEQTESAANELAEMASGLRMLLAGFRVS